MLVKSIANKSPFKELGKNPNNYSILEKTVVYFLSQDQFSTGMPLEQFLKVAQFMHPHIVKSLKESGLL